MADFRQLALEFVLADDEITLEDISQKAANELQNAQANTNPVARWVEAVQPWMPGSNGDEVMTSGDDTPDWTARAKALDFLSRTLNYIREDVLKPSQVKLLVTFFGAMFDVDHKAGIMASAKALSRISDMNSFQPQFGNDIIQKICALKDDFPRQVSGTRLIVYNLVKKLMSAPEVASDLQRRHEQGPGFMRDLVQLFRSERDPDCLMVWFDTLRLYLLRFSPSEESLEEVYGCFKSYFPITLPRTSQSGVTPDELKVQLRHCFSSNHLLAKHVFPFLLGKLDQGDAITVNVKLDILRTIKACLDQYSDAENSVNPYVNQIWGSLKYEVRNGEIEDTIWATLEVLKGLTNRLAGDALRDYTLNVTRECVLDFANATFTAPSGRLLVGVLSASPSAFVLMVSPAITHIKDNLRHRKSPSHSQDLLKILHVVLETRILLSETNMTREDGNGFAAVDVVFKSLYEDVYKGPVSLGSKENLSDEDIKIATQAAQGVGALICQRVASATVATGLEEDSQALLLPDQTCSAICDALFAIISEPRAQGPQAESLDQLMNETSKALQRAAMAYKGCYQLLVDKALKLIRASWTDQGAEGAPAIQNLALLLAFVGCSELPRPLTDGMAHLLYYTQSVVSELYASMDARAHPKVWCALVAGLQSAARYMNDACLARGPEKDGPFDALWVDCIMSKYPSLSQVLESKEAFTSTTVESADTPQATSTAELRNDLMLIGLFITRQLYRKVATPSSNTEANDKTLCLREDIASTDKASRLHYLHLISTFAGFICHEMSEAQQLSLNLDAYAFNLFYDDYIPVLAQPVQANDSPEPGQLTKWNWLLTSELNVLALGVLEVLRPSLISQLFATGVAPQILSTSGTNTSTEDSAITSVNRAIVTILSNRFKIETQAPLLSAIEEQAKVSLKGASATTPDAGGKYDLAQATFVFAIANGMLRRGDGGRAPGILQLLREAPRDPVVGWRLARRLEMVVAPQSFLKKENYAIVKPLWMQKAYVQLVKPMLSVAVGSDPDCQEPLIKTSHAIGVLSIVKHLDYSIFEEDTDEIVRISIMIAQSLGTGPELEAALEVIKKTLSEASNKVESHLRSLISICIQSFSPRASQSAHQRPDWVPEAYATSVEGSQSNAACGRLALEILGAMPSIFDSPQLMPFAPMVGKELTLGCGYHIRDLRRLARLARAAWAALK